MQLSLFWRYPNIETSIERDQKLYFTSTFVEFWTNGFFRTIRFFIIISKSCSGLQNPFVLIFGIVVFILLRLKPHIFLLIYYLNIKMKVCMYVCTYVCMYVRRQGRRTYTTNHPEIWHGLLISPWLSTEPGGDPKCWPPGVPPIMTPSEKPWRVKNWAGASKQKLLHGVGLPCKIFFAGGSPWPWARRVHPTNRGCMLWELGGGQQTKVAPRGGFVYNIFIYGGLTPTQSPLGP
jgi:hypothetical protein